MCFINSDLLENARAKESVCANECMLNDRSISYATRARIVLYIIYVTSKQVILKQTAVQKGKIMYKIC